MITVDLRDTHLIENVIALETLKKYGFSDERLQKLYDEQVEADKRRDNNERL